MIAHFQQLDIRKICLQTMVSETSLLFCLFLVWCNFFSSGKWEEACFNRFLKVRYESVANIWLYNFSPSVENIVIQWTKWDLNNRNWTEI